VALEVVLPETGCVYCGGRAVPEEEDGLVKYVCTACDNEFGHTLVAEVTDSSCQIGVPEEVRRAGSLPSLAGRSIDIPIPELTEAGKVFLGATIPRRPE
jgi:DNA-directed RNA polymerase subunit RPC12/RpoP